MWLKIRKKLWQEASDESGAGTFFAMTFALICIGIGGLAIDASNVWSVKQRLQSSTDIAAHAAAIKILYPDTFPDQTVSEVAIEALLKNMPEQKFGVALQASDVVEGVWDSATQQVATSGTASGSQAVSITARLDGTVGNVVPTFILKLVGFNYWQLSATAVFSGGESSCFDGGFIADGEVDVASNNDFLNGFCLHGNNGVDVNSNIVFGTGVRVSMPNSAFTRDGGMFALKGTNHTWEDGIENQVGDATFDMSNTSTQAINDIIAALSDPSDPDIPDYISSNSINRITVKANKPLKLADLKKNAINIIDCPNKGLDFPDNEDIEDMVIIADCKVNFGQGALVQNSIIATTNTGNQSFNAPSSLQLGRDDHCAPGGGVTLITQGDAHFSAQTEWYGAEVIAHGDVHISAIGDGIEGVSIQTGGDIFATSNLGMGSCNSNVDNYQTRYVLRMVR